MTASLYTATFLCGLFLPIALFAFVAALNQAQLQGETKDATEEYILASRSASQGDFVNSSTAYMLQVSTTFYFVYWGYHYGFSNIFYLATWAAGIALYIRFAPELLKIRHTSETVAKFLAPQHGIARKVCAAAAICSFLGVFYVEAFMTTDFVVALLPPAANTAVSTWWPIFIILCVVTVAYSVFGGLRKVIVTDNIQLGFAYLGFALIFSYLVHLAAATGTATALTGFSLCFLIYLILLWEDLKLRDGSLKRILLIASVIFMALMAIYSFSRPWVAGEFGIAGPFRQITEPWGAVTLAGFTVLNLLWQFCDSSNYQRIAALSLEGDEQQQLATLRRSLHRLVLVSPLTWGLGIVLGMLVKAAGVTVSGGITEYAALLSFLRDSALDGSVFAFLGVLGLAIAMVSIMMSTADSAIVASVQAYIRDIRRDGNVEGWTTIITLSLLISLFAVSVAYAQKTYTSSPILVVMAGVYSALAVLSPPALVHLLGWRTPPGSIVVSVVLGSVATWWAVFFPPASLPLNIKLVLPFFMSIGTSAGVQVMVMAFQAMRTQGGRSADG